MRWFVPIAFSLMLAGCNKQDTDSLARIGRKVAAHAKSSTGEMGAKVDLSWAGVRKEPSLQDKIQDRLRYENTLTEATFEVHVKDKQVELKGVVKTPLQRQRAIELAETVAGVDNVAADGITVREAE